MVRIECVEFIGLQGDRFVVCMEWLVGILCVYVVFVYCFFCFKDIFVVNCIVWQFVVYGYVVLCFDFIGLGYLEGDFVNINFLLNVEDLFVVVCFVESEYVLFDLLIGYSLGGVVVIVVVSVLLGIWVVVILGVLFDVVYVVYQFGDFIDKIEDEGIVEVLLGGCLFMIKC